MDGPLTPDEEDVLQAVYTFMRHTGRAPEDEQLEQMTGLYRSRIVACTYNLRARGLMGWRNGGDTIDSDWGPHGLTRAGALAAAALPST